MHSNGPGVRPRTLDEAAPQFREHIASLVDRFEEISENSKRRLPAIVDDHACDGGKRSR